MSKDTDMKEPNQPTKTYLWHIDHNMRHLPEGMDRAEVIREAMRRHALRDNPRETARENAIRMILINLMHAEKSPEVDIDDLFLRALRAEKVS